MSEMFHCTDCGMNCGQQVKQCTTCTHLVCPGCWANKHRDGYCSETNKVSFWVIGFGLSVIAWLFAFKGCGL